MQDEFIRNIRASLSKDSSIIEEISAILKIGYDAAYRRVNNKTNLTLEETVVLAKHFKISLNSLYNVGEQNTLLAEKSPEIKDAKDLENYFRRSMQSIAPLISMKSASIIYSAKDIPIFYTLADTLISKYKFYVWLKFLNDDGSMSKISFEKFIETVPKTLIESAKELSDRYNYLNVTEFWNDNTINGTLQQILYYFKTGLLSQKLALLICEDLKNIVDHVEQQTIKQVILNSKNNATYHLYKSDLVTMSNIVMIKTQHQKMFFSPFTVLTYLKVQDPITCNEMDYFFEKQKQNSKLLVSAGEKDRTQFFNRMLQKIEMVVNRINLNQDLLML